MMRSVQDAASWYPSLERYQSVRELRNALINPATSARLTSGGRSACWKCFLLFRDTDHSQWLGKLRDTRAAYESLRERFLRPLENPDEAGSSDPLSDDQDSPWDALRRDESIRQEIMQDVDRCMPENLYFRRPETQAMLLDVLFVWTKLNPDIGYRQGMHELLAPIVWVVEKDAINPLDPATDTERSTSLNAVMTLFDPKYIAHDCFTLFTQIMKDAKLSYEVSNESSGTDSATRTNSSAIIGRSNRIVFDYLALVDPHLSAHLRDIDLVPQIFLMRWIRLLFGREFSFDEMLQIWDRLFSLGNTTEHVDLTCVAMLLRVRWQLIDADYNEAITCLLRFPEPAKDHPAASLVDDAVYLRTHLDYDGGSEIVKKRTGRTAPPINRLNKPLTGQDGKSSPSRSRTPILDRSSSSGGGIESLLNDAARGISVRGQRWGVYKAVRDVAGEVRKNVSTIQSRAHSRMHSRSGSTTNLGTRDDLIQKIDSLDARNKSLAKMLEGAVSDLWKYHHDTSNNEAGGETQVDALTKTIAKVQFVQIYLEDASLELPTEDIASEVEQPEAEAGPISPAEASLSVSGQPDIGPSIPKDTKESAGEAGQENRAQALPKAETKGVKSEIPVPSTRTSTRPPLEQSSFSWILGQEPTSDSSRSPFVSPSPFSNSQIRTKGANRASSAFLFGAEDDSFGGSSSKNSSSAGGSNPSRKQE